MPHVLAPGHALSGALDVAKATGHARPPHVFWKDLGREIFVGQCIDMEPFQAKALPGARAGAVKSYQVHVHPPLPKGLRLHPHSGRLWGVPSEPVREQDYEVITESPEGLKGTSKLCFAVVAVSPPTGLAYPSLQHPKRKGGCFESIGALCSPGGKSSSRAGAVPAVQMRVGTELRKAKPEVQGSKVRHFEVFPALPLGLEIDPVEGAIGGTPTEAKLATTYTVTARNLVGEDTTELHLEVSAGWLVGALAAEKTTNLEAQGWYDVQKVKLGTPFDLVRLPSSQGRSLDDDRDALLAIGDWVGAFDYVSSSLKKSALFLHDLVEKHPDVLTILADADLRERQEKAEEARRQKGPLEPYIEKAKLIVFPPAKISQTKPPELPDEVEPGLFVTIKDSLFPPKRQPRWNDDQDVMLAAARKPGRGFYVSLASDRLRANRGFMLEVISVDPRAYSYASDELRQDEHFNHQIFNLHPGVLEYMDKIMISRLRGMHETADMYMETEPADMRCRHSLHEIAERL